MRFITAPVLACLAALAPFTAPAQAQDFPTRAITLVIPFPAGGSTDLVGRLVAQKLSDGLGQQVIVDNRGGAGGNLGSAAVAKAAPDGYTLLMGTVATHALNPAIYTKIPYDAAKDFAPISLLATVPNVLAVHPSVPAKTVQELIDLVKKEPGKYSYASSGNGTPLHLSGELFKSMAGVDIVHVPYKGSGPALIDVLGGQVPIDLRQSSLVDRAHQDRQAAGAGCDHREARRCVPGRSGHGRDPARLRDLHLERAVRPGRNAAGSRRQAQRRGQQGGAGSGAEGQARGIFRDRGRLDA